MDIANMVESFTKKRNKNQNWQGPEGPCPSLPHFNFQTKKGPTVSVSNMRGIIFYGCSEIIRTRNFTIFTEYATIFGQFMVAFHFFSN